MNEFTDDNFILQDDARTKNYKEEENTIEKNNKTDFYNWGQLKLFITNLQFLTNHIDKIDRNKRPIFVYVGAAPSISTYTLAKMFPNVDFHLYDSADFYKKLNELNNIKLYKKYFTDDDAMEWKKENDRVFYLSDIRDLQYDSTATDEERNKFIIKNMRDQEKWYNIIQPVASHLKFRMPNVTNNLETFEYLDGDIYFQPWVDKDSIEVRLVPHGKGIIKKWLPIEFNNKIAYFLNETRKKKKYYNPIYNNEEQFLNGVPNNFDSIGSFRILYNYFSLFFDDKNKIKIYIIHLWPQILENIRSTYKNDDNKEKNHKFMIKFSS